MSGYNGVKERAHKQRQRAKARREGMCSVCCKRPAKLGHLTCEVCLGRSRDRNRWISELVRAARAAG
jgi:hypothetical protein